MWRDLLLGLLVFALTSAETVVATMGNRADRQSTYAPTDRKSRWAAFWEGVFEAILWGGVILIGSEAHWLAYPAIAAAVTSKYLALERRRKKWRKNTGGVRRRRKPRTDGESDGAT